MTSVLRATESLCVQFVVECLYSFCLCYWQWPSGPPDPKTPRPPDPQDLYSTLKYYMNCSSNCTFSCSRWVFQVWHQFRIRNVTFLHVVKPQTCSSTFTLGWAVESHRVTSQTEALQWDSRSPIDDTHQIMLSRRHWVRSSLKSWWAHIKSHQV